MGSFRGSYTAHQGKKMSGRYLKKFLWILWNFLWITLSFKETKANTLENSYRLWTQINKQANFKESPHWLYYLEGNFRFFSPHHFYDQLIARSALGYQLTQRISVWQGYDFIPTYVPVQNKIRTEQRLWQQVTWQVTTSTPYSLSLRSRLEERYFEGQSQWGLRLRERLLFRAPNYLFQQYTTILSDEFFIASTGFNSINRNTINQNRFFVGVGIPVFKNSELSVGYLNQWLLQERNNQMNHILFFTLTL